MTGETPVPRNTSTCNGPRVSIFHAYTFRHTDDGAAVEFIGVPHETMEGAIQALQPIADAFPDTRYLVGNFAMLTN